MDHLGYFIPAKAHDDVLKFGSTALYTLMEKASSFAVSERISWLDAQNLNLTEEEINRRLVELITTCVLVAYDLVLSKWRASMAGMSEADVAKTWLLIQFCPIQALGADWFRKLAETLFDHALFEKSMNLTNEISCFVDEAQLITGMSRLRVFGNQETALRPISHRSPLRPLLQRIQELCPAVAVAGTGFSIAEEQKTLTSQMGIVGAASDIWKFTDFPLLNSTAVKQVLVHRLNIDESLLDVLSSWLEGRPRWACAFVELVLNSGRRVDTGMAESYLSKLVTSPPLGYTLKTPDRSPAGAFLRLGGVGDEQARSLETGQPTGLESHARTVMFHGVLEVGLGMKPRKPVDDMFLVELDLAYLKRDQDILMNLEPVIVQAGWNYLSVPGRAFFADSMNKVLRNQSALGSLFEYVVATALCESMFPRVMFNAHVAGSLLGEVVDKVSKLVFTGDIFRPALFPTVAQEQGLRRFEEWPLLNKMGFDWGGVAEEVSAHFKGVWCKFPSVSGRYAMLGDGDAMYAWLDQVLDGARVPSVFLPDVNAGPDTILAVHRPGKPKEVMLVFFQEKFEGGKLVGGDLSKAQIDKALPTIDPSLLHTHKRRVEEDAEPMVKFKTKRDAFLLRLREVPVVRVLVSGAADIKDTRAKTSFIEHARAGAQISHDLLVVVDREAFLKVLPEGERSVVESAKQEQF